MASTTTKFAFLIIGGLFALILFPSANNGAFQATSQAQSSVNQSIWELTAVVNSGDSDIFKTTFNLITLAPTAILKALYAFFIHVPVAVLNILSIAYIGDMIKAALAFLVLISLGSYLFNRVNP